MTPQCRNCGGSGSLLREKAWWEACLHSSCSLLLPSFSLGHLVGVGDNKKIAVHNPPGHILEKLEQDGVGAWLEFPDPAVRDWIGPKVPWSASPLCPHTGLPEACLIEVLSAQWDVKKGGTLSLGCILSFSAASPLALSPEVKGLGSGIQFCDCWADM